MKEKYIEKYEQQIRELAENRIKTNQYKVFDNSARVIKRARFPELVEQGKSDDENCLVIINGEGETIVLTSEFEFILMNVSKGWFSNDHK